ncbi:MAG TPA: sulfite exporter TauE/SafE family protein, partial [Ramlibacter sp.]
MTSVAWADWAGVASAILLAYTVFGLTGFGSAVVAVPILVHFVALKFAVPLVMLLDFGATLAVGALNWRLVRRAELARLVPCMLVGIIAGVTLLVSVEPRWLLLALGVFVLFNALWNLLRPVRPHPVSAWWSVPAGVGGGVFSALFGTGGPVYTTYLARRIEGPTFRATISSIILMSGVIR